MGRFRQVCGAPKQLIPMTLAAAFIMMLCLPVTASAELLDKDADPPVIARSGSFNTTYKTQMDFSISGGNLTGASWSRAYMHVGYILTGTCKAGETISLSVTGTQSPVPDENPQCDLVSNYLNMSGEPFSKDGKRISEPQKYNSGKVQDPSLSHQMDFTVPSDASMVKISGSFSCSWVNPYTVATELVYVTVNLEVEESPEAALPIAPGTEPSSPMGPDPAPEGTENKEPVPPGPVKQIDDSRPGASAGEETTDVKTAAILGIAATIAAIAGAGAAAGGTAGAAAGGTSGTAGNVDSTGQKSTEEAARQKTGDYRMIVYKSFGDTIHHGKTDEYVVARIEYKDEQTGTWVFDEGRSNAISITISQVKGLELYPPPLNSGAPGKGHTIIFTNKEPAETQATLSFKFTAPDGGFFQRNMVFQLMGESRIELDSNKVWFLEGDYDPFDLKCRLIGYDPAKYDICLKGMDGFFTLEMAKNVQGGDVIKVTPAQGVYDDWNKHEFIYSYPCSIAYEDKQTMEKTAEIEFTVNLCYEGIGLAMSHPQKPTKIDELLKPFELWAFSDAENHRRTEEMFRLALTVARWNDKKRFLEYDTAAAETLELDYSVDISSDEFKTESAKTKAMRALKDAALRTSSRGEKPFGFRGIEYRADMKPAFFTTITTQGTESGLVPFPVLLTISLPDDKCPELVLKGIFNPMCEWEKVVRWFFAVPADTFAAAEMKIGNPDLYVEALKFIENRVYSFSNVPFAPNSNENHYEDGIIASTTHKRLRSVVMRDGDIPTGIGDYKKAQTLVHELTHALEHKNMGSTWTLFSASAGHERHTYFLQYASDAIYELALAERGANVEENVRLAIASMHRSYFNSNNTPERRNLEWFGAHIPTQHNLFKAYLDSWLQIGTGTDSGRVGEIISRNYFPGALKNENRDCPANFEIQSGKLKGSCFMFSWGSGRLGKFSVWHKDYKFVVKSPLHWIGGFTLKTRLEIIDKLTLGGMSTGHIQRGRDTFTVTFTAPETFDAENPEYKDITGFNAVWQLESGNDVHSIAAPDVRDGKMTTALISNNSLKRKHED